jgi:hypothetical protein
VKRWSRDVRDGGKLRRKRDMERRRDCEMEIWRYGEIEMRDGINEEMAR